MALQRFEKKVALVTGGAAGIGEGIVRRLHEEGGAVVIGDVDLATAEALAAELGDRAMAVRCDVSDPAQIEGAVHACVSRFGGLDILCNNAGVAVITKTTEEIQATEWSKVMDVGINAVFHCAKAALPHLRKTRGSIVNIASISGLGGDYGFTAYNASKAAIINYTRSLALDHAADGIRVNAICPGTIDTPASRQLQDMPELFNQWLRSIPLQRVGTSAEIGAAVAYLASEDAAFVTGAILVVDGGVSATTGQPNIKALIEQFT